MSIYMDNAATTPLSPSVIVDICRNIDNYGNPSGLYQLGYDAKNIIEDARRKVAKAINAEPEQIFFTSGATESNNWVCSMYDYVCAEKYEHHSITNQPNFLDVNEYDNYLGRGYLMGKNILFSRMLVNNEIGFIDDDVLRGVGVPHSDLTQAIGNIPVDVKALNIDYGSFSAHKFHGLKGVGVLYVKDPTSSDFKPYHYGGQQEFNLRAGTENVIGISAMGVAIEEAVENIDKKQEHCKCLRNEFISYLKKNDINFIVNGENLPHIDSILSLSFKDRDNSSMLIQLDEKGIACSSGSACNSGNSEPSETLKYLNVPKEYINGTLRFSFSLENTIDEVDYVCYNISRIIKGGN